MYQKSIVLVQIHFKLLNPFEVAFILLYVCNTHFPLTQVGVYLWLVLNRLNNDGRVDLFDLELILYCKTI